MASRPIGHDPRWIAPRRHPECPPTSRRQTRRSPTCCGRSRTRWSGPPPRRGLTRSSPVEAYLGDVVDLTFNGDDEQRVALIARLLTLARVVNAERDADLHDYAWLRRLERPLRRWERDRRLGTASPRPRPAELDARMAMFGAAIGPDAVIGAQTVAVSVAELVAIHQLAGATSLEEAIAARAALQPLLDDAAALLRRDTPDFGVGVYEQPGATLAHVEQATWQIEQILRHPRGRRSCRGCARCGWRWRRRSSSRRTPTKAAATMTSACAPCSTWRRRS